MPAKFEIYTDKGEEWRFNLIAPNGEVIASSEGYTSKANCLNGVESVKRWAADADTVEKEE
jgi:uncharacterized protein